MELIDVDTMEIYADDLSSVQHGNGYEVLSETHNYQIAGSAKILKKNDMTGMGSLPQSGSKGPLVVELQGLLISNGFSLPVYGIDGDFGGETRSAVMQAQSKFGLKVDGIVSNELMSYLRGDNKESTNTAMTTTNVRSPAAQSTLSKIRPIHVGGIVLSAALAWYWFKMRK